MTVAQAIDPSGTATTQFTDADGLNPRNSPPYEDGYVVHTFSSTTSGQKLRVTEGGTVGVVVGAEASADVTVTANDYAIIVGDDGSPPETTYALGQSTADGGSVVITYAYAAPTDVPVVTTDAATDIYTEMVTLNGTLSDMGGLSDLTVHFIYGLSGGSLDQSTVSGADLATSTGAFSYYLTGLEPNTAYEYQAVVTDGVTVWYAASSQTFTTSEVGTTPELITYSAMAVTSTSAVLVGTLVTMGGNTELDVFFEWGTSTAYGNTTTTYTKESEDANGNFPDPTGQTLHELAGLTAETTYHYRVVATDGTSYWYGSDRQFVTTEAETGETGDVAGYLVELGPAEEGHPTVTGTTPPEDPNETYFIFTTNNYYNETGLSAIELRRCRVKTMYVDAEDDDWSDWLETYPGDLNGDGVVDEDDGIDPDTGEEITLSVQTDQPTSVSNTGATLNGELTNLGGHSAADVFFKVKKGSSLVTTTTAQELTAVGTFSDTVSDLERNTTYTVQAFAQAEAEQAVGEVITFVTGGAVVNTLNADPVGDTTATLNGELVSLADGTGSPEGLDVYFEWGFNFEEKTTDETKSTLGLFDAALTDLEANTEYVFKAAATDGTTVWYGEALTFTTTFDVVVITHDPSDLTTESATLNGSINSSLASIDYYFEYGFTTSYGLTTTLTEITETDGAEPVSAAIEDLTAGTEYHCRLVAVDDTASPSDYWYGDDVMFVTPGTPPGDDDDDDDWPGGQFPGDDGPGSGTTIVESHMQGLWLWDVFLDTGTEYMSTRACSYNGNDYTAQILPETFRGIESRVDFGSGLLSSSDVTFEMYFDSSDSVTSKLATLEGTEVLITLLTGEGVAADIGKQWRFIVERATYASGIIKCYCKSILQYYLQGDYPKTKNPQEIWPSSDPDIYTNYCVPVIFGTANIPIKSVNTGEGAAPFNERKYVLGPSGPTYTVERVQAPREKGSSTWESSSYAFEQSTHNSHRLVQFLIDETVGPPYGNGVWTSGATMLIPFVKYYRSDTVGITNPADIIAYVLRDMGVKASHLDTGSGSTFEEAATIFASRGMVWQGGFWEKRSREAILSQLLSMCDAYLYEGNKIELHTFTSSNHEYFDKTIENTFRINPTLVQQNDGGPVEWPALDAPQDVLPGKTTVSIDPFESDVVSSSRQPFQYRFQYGTQIPQKLAILYYQKQHSKNRVSFTTSVLDVDNLPTLIPGKVITLYNPMVFRMSGGVVVTSMHINYDLRIDIDAVQLTQMHSWDVMPTPDAVTIITDTSTDTMS